MFKRIWYYFFPPEYLHRAKARRELLRKVFFYRRNTLTATDKKELSNLAERFREAYEAFDKAALARLEQPCDKLLARLGGHYYHHYHWFENTETLVVAAILAIAIRSYFLQPFKIPTNSMWPTYYGMNYKLRGPNDLPPNFLTSTWRFLWLGMSQHTLTAPTSGEVLIPVFNEQDRLRMNSVFRYRLATEAVLGFFPVKVRAYDFVVGDQIATLKVPFEFSLDKLILEKFFPGAENSAQEGHGTPLKVSLDNYVDTGIRAEKGQTVLAFELEGGDMLFVDRVSYYFRAPCIGDPIVFRTREIKGLADLNGGIPDDKYYIKRLAGYNGDKIEIRDHTLFRNEKPAHENSAFFENATQTPPYRGYANAGNLTAGAIFNVPARHCFALGDNSYESLDSRYWGPFDQSQLIGKAVFIYYPFSVRWGLSR
jgi:signal peptidase I